MNIEDFYDNLYDIREPVGAYFGKLQKIKVNERTVTVKLSIFKEHHTNDNTNSNGLTYNIDIPFVLIEDGIEVNRMLNSYLNAIERGESYRNNITNLSPIESNVDNNVSVREGISQQVEKVIKNRVKVINELTNKPILFEITNDYKQYYISFSKITQQEVTLEMIMSDKIQRIRFNKFLKGEV